MQPMQPMSSVPPALPEKKVSAFRVGLLFGIILAVILIALGFAEQFLKDFALVFRIVSVIAALILYFFAGFRASSQSGKVSTGLLAGMWTGLISGVLNGVVGILLIVPRLADLTAQANQLIINSGAQTSIRYTETTLLVATIVSSIVFIVIGSAIALGVGAIGGAAGKGRAPLPAQTYQESLYQSPMAGYPPQPGNYPPEAGGYPPHR